MELLLFVFPLLCVPNCFFFLNQEWGAADTEIKVPSVENPELANVLLLKPGVDENIAMHALPTARNFFLFI